MYRITTVLLGLLLLQQSAKVTEVKFLVRVALWLHKPPPSIFSSPWSGEGLIQVYMEMSFSLHTVFK